MIGENGIVNPNDLKKSGDAFVLTLNAGSIGGQTPATIATNAKATEKARAILGQSNN